MMFVSPTRRRWESTGRWLRPVAAAASRHPEDPTGCLTTSTRSWNGRLATEPGSRQRTGRAPRSRRAARTREASASTTGRSRERWTITSPVSGENNQPTWLTIYFLISISSSLSNSRSTESQDQKKGLIRKERAKKLRGNPSVTHSKEAAKEHKYHFCQHCI